jgi:3'-phosphoadenosine 5'-phosphosulfate (PAPS) 3'-phosphatase
MTTVNLLDLAASALIATVGASGPIRSYSTINDSDDDKKNAHFKKDGTVVTDADFEAQGIIVRALRQTPGDFRIIGEESQEEMELHMKEETQGEAEERKRLFRLAQLEMYNRFQHIDMEAPPLSHENVDIPDDTILPSMEELSDSPEYIVDASRVSVYVDPLDGTKSYAKGDYDAVTILVAIILDNVPYFGVITKPFGYKSYSTILETHCVSVYGGALLKGVYLAGGTKCEVNALGDDLPRAVISSSRSEGIVRDFVDHLAEHDVIHPDPILVSGAGEKSLRLVLGNEKETLWFFPKAGTSRWDIAASDALLRALGGAVTDKYGQELDYSKSREDAENVDGIIASNSSTLHAECIRLFKEGDWKSR